MIQMDASCYPWVLDEIWYLHLAIDDSTGTVVGAYFDRKETLNAYYHVFYQILKNYGIPAMFYTDRRTLFEYKRKNNAFDNDDTYTQFSYACKNLGINIKTTSVAQAKGRIERMNQTFQSRLPIELRRACITNIEDANNFLNSYLQKFNVPFSLPLNTIKSVCEEQPTDEKINHTLAVLSERKIDSGHCIKYKNKFYLPVSKKGTPVYLKRNSTCLVIKSFNGQLYRNIVDQLYVLEEVPAHQRISQEFNIERIPVTTRKKYILPLDHRWISNV